MSSAVSSSSGSHPVKVARIDAPRHSAASTRDLPIEIQILTASFLPSLEACYFLGKIVLQQRSPKLSSQGRNTKFKPDPIFLCWQRARQGISSRDWNSQNRWEDRTVPKICAHIAKYASVSWLKNLDLRQLPVARLLEVSSLSLQNLKTLHLQFPAADKLLHEKVITNFCSNAHELADVTADGWSCQDVQVLVTQCAKLTTLKIQRLIERNEREQLSGFAWRPIAEGLAKLKKFESLYLDEAGALLDAELSYVAAIPQLKSVLFQGDVYSFTARVFERHSGLEKVRLHNCSQLTDDTVRQLIALPNLSFLEINACPQITIKAVMNVKQARKLRSLVLGQIVHADTALGYISDSRSVTSLTLSECDVSDKGLNVINPQGALRELTIVGGKEKITDRGILAAAKVLRELRLRAVRSAQIDGMLTEIVRWKGVTLAGMLKVVEEGPRLRVLHLPKEVNFQGRASLEAAARSRKPPLQVEFI